ncbi:hypothetical protein [Nibrella saemangeumensis]
MQKARQTVRENEIDTKTLISMSSPTQAPPTDVANQPYRFTKEDMERLQTRGELPPSVWDEFQQTGRLRPAHEEVVRMELGRRLWRQETNLPEQLLQIYRVPEYKKEADSLAIWRESTYPINLARHEEALQAKAQSPTVPENSVVTLNAPVKTENELVTVPIVIEQRQQAPLPHQESTSLPVGEQIPKTAENNRERVASTNDQIIEERPVQAYAEDPIQHKESSPAEEKPTIQVTWDIATDAEKGQRQDYQLLLPPEAEHLRSYLESDKLLANPDLTTRLYDAGLQKEELAAQLQAIGVTDNPQHVNQLTDYLWDVHEFVKDLDLSNIDPTKTYRVQYSIPSDGQHTELQSTIVPPAPEPIPPELGIELVRGGLLANFFHNLQKNYSAANIQVYQSLRFLEVSSPDLNESNGLPGQEQSNLKKLEQTTRFQWDQVADQLTHFGFTPEKLQETGALQNFLNGGKTGLITLERTINNNPQVLVGKIYIVAHPELGPRVHF